MNIFNQITTFIFQALFFPFQFFGDFWGLFVIAALTGVLMLLIFKKVSNQAGIRRTKNRIKAHLLAIRLYKHDAVLSLETIGLLFGENGRYLLYAFKPMLILSVPVLIILIQVGSRYGFQPARIDQPILVSVRLAENIDPGRLSLFVSDNIVVETPPLHIPAQNEIYWRVRPTQNGAAELRFLYQQKAEEKKLVTGGRRPVLAAKRVRALALEAFLYPAEPALAVDSFLTEIHVDYAENKIRVAGVQMQWMVFFFIVSIATGLLAKGFFKVEL